MLHCAFICRFCRWLLPICLIAVILIAPSQRHATAQEPGWRATSLMLPTSGQLFCFDAARPNILLAAEAGVGTVAYDWDGGRRNVLTSRLFTICGPGGLLFATESAGGPAWRFSLDNVAGQVIDHRPTHIAADGSLHVYALEDGRLWASADGGLTWQERGQGFGGRIRGLAVAPADGRAIYIIEGPLRTHPLDPPPYRAIHFSADAGVMWEQRYRATNEPAPGSLEGGTLVAAGGAQVPIDTVELLIRTGGGPSSFAITHWLSTDGARTFKEIGVRSAGSRVQLIATSAGLVRLRSATNSQFFLEASSDGGRTWQPLSLPYQLPALGTVAEARLQYNRDNSNQFFLSNQDGSGDLWYSGNAGTNWKRLAANKPVILIALGRPTRLLGLDANGVLSILELPQVEQPAPYPPPTSAPLVPCSVPGSGLDSQFFPETGHTLSGVFKRYWETHGGLAQFGYPKTEPLCEVNAEDGKTYTVQYFERNRFEYHPELAGTPYEVLLGLLGNQLTAARRAASEAPFNRVADPVAIGVVYFPATGHTLSGHFRRYWESHGGLAIYGYPISQEFAEVNAEDGNVYMVQYFERNRFEYHPELAGTPYEVLLGLLGNLVLRERESR